MDSRGVTASATEKALVHGKCTVDALLWGNETRCSRSADGLSSCPCCRRGRIQAHAAYCFTNAMDLLKVTVSEESSWPAEMIASLAPTRRSRLLMTRAFSLGCRQSGLVAHSIVTVKPDLT